MQPTTFVIRDLYIAVLLILSSIENNGINARPPEPYYGKLIGQFVEYAHGVKGSIYAVDESTIFVKGFVYDGTAPDAFFWVGNSIRPSPDGHIIPYPEEYSGREPPVLRTHNSSDIILRLPMGKRLRDIKWLSVWCRRFTVNFGDVLIKQNLDVPKPRVLPEFKRIAHGLRSSNISILDSKTFYIPNLHYDGAGPDAYFWVGNGSGPNIMGTKVPNELGSYDVLRGYQGEDIEIQLPNNLTVYDIDWLSVWCIEYRHNFGHVIIPKDLDVPPALGQTKIAPEWWYNPTTSTSTQRPKSKNCKEIIDGKLQVEWEVQKDYAIIELIGRISEDEYMAFGISGANGRSQMIYGDVVVAFFDRKELRFRAEDYYISHLSQCDGNRGVCPDERIGAKNDAILMEGDRKNGVTSIKYRRLLQTNDPVNDQAIPLDREVNVISAIGPLNERREANSHSHSDDSHNVESILMDFNAQGEHSCTSSLYDLKDSEKVKAWPTRVLRNQNVITARIGPTGGNRGYSRITGHPSWGIAWYLNDLLIPELHVVRGQTYTFLVEGGNDETNPARYHPLYISDSPEGGYGQKSPTEQARQVIYAGVEYNEDGDPRPTADGRYCEWQHMTIDKSEDIETFEDYMKTLKLECDNNSGEAAVLNWTVSVDTPDTVYYQCYTHNNLGWKIHVVNSGTKLARDGVSSIFSTHSLMLLLATTICHLAITMKISSL